MQTVGLMIVRNEVDILHTNVLHHLAVGVDRFLIVDNGSEDGTDRLLQDLSGGGRVSYTRYDGPYRQSEIITELALEAFLGGADWVIPIDADEFWYALGGDFRKVLEESTAGALSVKVVNFIQRREQRGPSSDALLHMTWRVPQAIGPLERVQELVKTRQNAYIEMMYPPKWISRASLALHIGVGNHEVTGLPGSSEAIDTIVCLHAPLRSRSVFEAQLGHARRAAEAGNFKTWHWQHWQQLAEKGELDKEWRANSHAGGCLDVYGVEHPLIPDFRLRDVVAPWIGRTAWHEPASSPPPFSLDNRFAQCELDLVGPALARMNRIEGWFTDAEAQLAMTAVTLALMREPHPVVEVGSYCGRSTVALGSVVKAVCPNVSLYAIDPHEGETAPDACSAFPTLEKFQKNIEDAGLGIIVETVQKCSYEVSWNGPIGFLFIDGFHDYLNVCRDFIHFQKWLTPGGYVAFHDYDDHYPDVKAFVKELLVSGQYREFLRVDSLIVLERIMNATEHESHGRPELDMRFERQSSGIAVLRDILRDTMSRSKAELAKRDKSILELQEELFAKVGERDRVILDLQAELHQKVGKCNHVIEALQTELHAKVGERDKIIRDLQAELERLDSEAEI